MTSQSQIACVYCNRLDFLSQNALRRHQAQGYCHQRKQLAEQQMLSPVTTPRVGNQPIDYSFSPEGYFDSPTRSLPSPPRKRAFLLENITITTHDMDYVTREIGPMLDEASAYDSSESSLADDFGANYDSDQSTQTSEEEAMFLGGLPKVEVATSNSPDTTMRDSFREYVKHARKNFLSFTEEEKSAVGLLHTLKAKKAPMNAFESIMLWHLKQSNQLRQHQTLRDSSKFIGRETIIKKLAKRYNYTKLFPVRKRLLLPVSGAKVTITCHDAKASIVRLLTDPRIEPQDYLMWNNDPLAGPPEELEFIGDLNTGQAYIQTHAVLITKKGQQLLPIILYCDGTPVSHFHDLEIIQVKIALGIMTRVARQKAHCWATLGFIEKVHEQGGRGRAIVKESNHLDTQDNEVCSSDDSASVHEGEGVGEKNDQDFHAMMELILEEYRDIQRTGFMWDFHHPTSGITYMGMEYQIFMPFIRSDTKEADLLCAKYGQRHSTQQICRKCKIPLQEADNHLAKHQFKTVPEIKSLIDDADLEGLKALSQTYLRNAFHNIRFSLGNTNGVHGSCPSELLHAFLLGSFKYLRDIFFEMLGKDSEGARQINALASVYSRHFARQSDRTVPGTTFTRGIQVGKLMAKDYRGVLLIMLVMLRSTKGRSILKKYQKFKQASDLDDWILLMELMLEWESYLNEPKMAVKHVKRLEKKHRYIMYVMRKVAQRNKGMGLKLMKFHTILHIWEDIMQFGVPLEFDTSANEMHHKPSKQASKQTQRATETFNFQTATRLTEYDLLDLAMEEIETGRVPWQYFDHFAPEQLDTEGPEGQEPLKKPATHTGETKIELIWSEDGDITYRLRTKSKFQHKTRINVDLLVFLHGLQEMIYGKKEGSLAVWTVHRREDQIFRAHPNYRGKGPWRDWVWVNWGPSYGHLPCHIWSFVVIDDLPTGPKRLNYGGIPLKKGTYAVVETAVLDHENVNLIGTSDLLTPYVKADVSLDNNGWVQDRVFYLADVEAFVEPCCVVPDLGGPGNRYFVLKPRNKWAKEFVRWIEDPHKLDQMDTLDSVEEEEDVMQNLEEERATTK